MRYSLFIISSLLTLAPLSALTPETERLDNTIYLLEHTVEQAKGIKKDVERYLLLQQSYMVHPEDKNRAFAMVKAAKELLDSLQSAHLEQAMPEKFLEELALFAEMGKKRGLPKP